MCASNDYEVSIPHRYALNGPSRRVAGVCSHVSIPHRYALNVLAEMLGWEIDEFQFLIGTL